MVIDAELTAKERLKIAALQPEDERCIVGKCPYCGEICNDLLPTHSDELRCGECDSEYELCGICDEEQHVDSPCRHLFRLEWGEWCGSGYGNYREARESFLALLEAMHPWFAADLRAAILSGEFYTWAILPLVGSGGLLEMYGMPNLPPPTGMCPTFYLFLWGDQLMELGSGDLAEELHDGYHWIASLYKTETLEANRITVSWIEQWLAGRTNRMLFAPETNAVRNLW